VDSATPTKARRLLVLASTLPVSEGDGVPAFVLDIAREEAKRFDVTVLAPRVPGAYRTSQVGNVVIHRFPYFFTRWEDLADGAILDNLKAKPSRMIQVFPLLVAQVLAVRAMKRKLSPDAIHAHWIIPQGLTNMLTRPLVPTLITTHGGDIYALRSRPLEWIKKVVLRRAAAISTVNSEMAAKLISWSIDPAKVSVLPMGVPLDETGSIQRGEARVDGSVLVVGRLVEKKGIGTLLSALRTQVQGREWSLRIVGDGPLKESLQEQASGLPVLFLGQRGREEVLREMASASIVVLPSVVAASGDQEGLPVVLLEAAAMGAAIVASDISGINEVIISEENGLLVPQGDPVPLGAALCRLLDDAELRRRLGEAARDRAALYSTESIGARYAALIDTIVP
jgi:glycosyltransferase involved in cell wall biosynthesis